MPKGKNIVFVWGMEPNGGQILPNFQRKWSSFSPRLGGPLVWFSSSHGTLAKLMKMLCKSNEETIDDQQWFLICRTVCAESTWQMTGRFPWMSIWRRTELAPSQVNVLYIISMIYAWHDDMIRADWYGVTFGLGHSYSEVWVFNKLIQDSHCWTHETCWFEIEILAMAVHQRRLSCSMTSSGLCLTW